MTRLWKWLPGERTPSEHENDVALAIAAGSNAFAVFLIDTFTSIESAVAVFYVIIMLLASDFLSREGVLAAGVICTVLCVASFFLSHGIDNDLATFLRLVGSLCALIITTVLLCKNEMSRVALLTSHNRTKSSEYRYRSIFKQSGIALWEQDLTGLNALLQGLRAEGVEDLCAYKRSHPDFTKACTEAIRTVALNDAALELLGNISHEQGVGPISRFIPADCPSLFGFVKAFFQGQRRFEAKGRIRDFHGSETIILLAVEFPEDQTGLDRIVIGLVDITEREAAQATMMAAQAELARASRASAVGALSASLAHELNQPLGALLMNAQASLRWLNRNPPDLKAAIRAAERTMRDGERASQIVKTTKAMLSRTPIESENVDLVGLIEETRTLLEYEIERQNISIDLISPYDVPKANASKSELQQVLINLITNAMQAMEEAHSKTRRIAIQLSTSEMASVIISVSDSGPGLSSEAIENVFDPYFTTKPFGMGMGLAICKSTVEARGGRLAARNNDTGGATFEITLPVEDRGRLTRLYDVPQMVVQIG